MTDQAGRFRINWVAETTGIAEATLRAWERRYQVPKPARTPSGYRLYSQGDLDQVRRMRDLCEAGVSAADAAKEVLEMREEAIAAPSSPAGEVRLLEVVAPEHANSAGVLALHRAVALMERAATVAATRSARSNAIAVTCEAVSLLVPVDTGSLVAASACVIASRDGTLSVEVELSTEDIRTGEHQPVARSTFTLVSAAEPPREPGTPLA